MNCGNSTTVCASPRHEPWESFANLGMVLIFMSVSILGNKFMLVRNTFLRNKQHCVLTVSPPSSITPLLDSATGARHSRQDSSGVLGPGTPTNPSLLGNKPPTPGKGTKGSSTVAGEKRPQQHGSKNKRNSSRSFPVGGGGVDRVGNVSFGSARSASDVGAVPSETRQSTGSSGTGGHTAGPTSFVAISDAERDLEANAEQVLDEQRAVEVDLGRFINDGTMVFFLLMSLYALLMATITLSYVLTQSQHFSRPVPSYIDDVLLVFPILFYYGIIASLCEKLFSLTDLLVGRHKRAKRMRRFFLFFVSQLPMWLLGAGVIIFRHDSEVFNNLPYLDIFCAAVLSITLAVAGYTATQTEGAGSAEQRSLCVRVSVVSIFFILGRAAVVLPYVQNHYFSDRSLLFQHFIFNIAIVVPISCALLVLKVRFSHHEELL